MLNIDWLFHARFKLIRVEFIEGNDFQLALFTDRSLEAFRNFDFILSSNLKYEVLSKFKKKISIHKFDLKLKIKISALQKKHKSGNFTIMKR